MSRYRFGGFELDVSDRQLWSGDTRVELSARYFDVLVLLVQNHNTLIDKERLFEEVWKDVVVSDSALSQCIKEIRKQLHDDASAPRFVQTVPRHGYRFIADVQEVSSQELPSPPSPHSQNAGTTRAKTKIDTDASESSTLCWQKHFFELTAGTIGGAVSGLFGGLLYGFGLVSSQADVGAISTILVLTSLTVLLGSIGGFGVSLGIAGGGVAGHFKPEYRVLLRISGAALGGLIVGATAKLLGVDAFNLLTGRAPAGITGGPEGAALGAAIILGAYLGEITSARSGKPTASQSVWDAGIAGAFAGILIPLTGGHLLGGSLELLASSFTESRIQLDTFASIFGGVHFGLATEMILAGVEGLLFGCFVVGSLTAMERLRNKQASAWRL